MSDPRPAPAAGESSLPGCLLRLFWMAAGPMALVLIGIFVAQGRTWALSWGDAAYWVIVAAMAVARFIDVSRFAGTTVNGAPSTTAHLRRYLLLVPAAAACWWAAAHALVQTGWLR